MSRSKKYIATALAPSCSHFFECYSSFKTLSNYRGGEFDDPAVPYERLRAWLGRYTVLIRVLAVRLLPVYSNEFRFVQSN